MRRASSWLGALVLAASACSAPSQQVSIVAPAKSGAVGQLLAAEQAAFAEAAVDPAALKCLARQRWSTTLRADAKFTAAQVLDEMARNGVQVPEDKREPVRKQLVDTLFWRLVLTQILDGELHNLGAAPLGGLKSADGRPLLLIRTAFTPDPAAKDSCVQSLVQAGVRHIVNLYAGPMPTQPLEAAENSVVSASGGTYYTARNDPQGNWREDLREGDGGEAKKAAMAAVAALISQQILHPSGGAPKGHVQIHCGGGMHRTGMIFGVFERCVNKAPWPQVAEAYKRHVGWRSDAEPGGFEPQNLKFIEEFDCAMIR